MPPPPAHSTHTPHFHPHPLPLSSLCFVTEATQSFSFVAEIVLLWLICSLCACTIRDCIVDVCIFYFIITLILTAARDENSNNKHLHTLAALSRIRLHRVQLVGILVLSFSSFFSWGNFWKINPWNWNLILLSTSAYACVCVCRRMGGYLCPAGGVLYFSLWFISLCSQLAVKLHWWKTAHVAEFLRGGTESVYLLKIYERLVMSLSLPCCLAVSLSPPGSRAQTCSLSVSVTYFLMFAF